MSKSEFDEFLNDLAKDAKNVGAEVKGEFSKASQKVSRRVRLTAKLAKKDVKNLAENVDRAVGEAAIEGEKLYKKGEEIYEKANVKDIAIGAGLGAKAGFIASRFAPFLVKPLTVFGTIAGGIAGQKGVKKVERWKDVKYKAWLDKHKAKKKKNSPSL